MIDTEFVVIVAIVSGVFGAMFVDLLAGKALKGTLPAVRRWFSPLHRAERARVRRIERKAAYLVRHGVPAENAYWYVASQERAEAERKTGVRL